MTTDLPATALEATRRWLDPFRPGDLTERHHRRGFYAGAALAMLALTVLVVPTDWLEPVFGALRNDDGAPFVPRVSLFVSMVCLIIATLLAAYASRRTRGERLTFIVLAALALGIFGPLARVVIQSAALHGFYVGGDEQRYDALTRYWGVTFLLLAVVPLLSATSVLISSLLPAGRPGSRYRIGRRRISASITLVTMPVIAILVLTALTLVVPSTVLLNLGYSAPELAGGDYTFSASGMGVLAWLSFQRIGYLPLLIGMWAGMESARAAVALTDARLTRVTSRARGRVPVTLLGLGLLVVIVAWQGYYIAAIAGLLLGSLVGLASSGVFTGLTAVDTLEDTEHLGVSDEWRSAAPIAQILLILSLPAWLPLVYDGARGIGAPFALVVDHDRFVDFWRQTPITQVDFVSVDGVFVDRLREVGYFGLAFAALAIVVVVLSNIMGNGIDNGGWFVFQLARLGLLALAALAITRHADEWVLGPFLALCGLPFLAVLFSLNEQTAAARLWEFLAAALLIGIWAWVIGTTSSLPTYTLLVATLLWRFVIDAGDLNVPRESESGQARLLAGFGALTFLALGMMLIDHGGDQSYYATSAFSTTTDQVGLTVIAAVWLVHLHSSREAARIEAEADESQAHEPALREP